MGRPNKKRSLESITADLCRYVVTLFCSSFSIGAAAALSQPGQLSTPSLQQSPSLQLLRAFPALEAVSTTPLVRHALLRRAGRRFARSSRNEWSPPQLSARLHILEIHGLPFGGPIGVMYTTLTAMITVAISRSRGIATLILLFKKMRKIFL